MKQEKTEHLIALAENGIGDYLKTHREAGGYLQKEICDGICSVATLSRIEAGERIVDFLMIETFLDRMKIIGSEYEFVLDEEDYCAYRQREEIRALVKSGEYEKAERPMAAYRNQYGEEELQGQFLHYQKALLAQAKQGAGSWAAELFLKALLVTAPEYRKKFTDREIMSNLELSCITEMIHCMEDPAEQERGYEALYLYFAWSYSREGFFPVPYRRAMQYYAECLYKAEKYERCIQMCDKAIKELFRTSKIENREELFLLRAKAREGRGIESEEEKRICLKDYLAAYHLISFYRGEENLKALKQYIGGKFGWQYID